MNSIHCIWQGPPVAVPGLQRLLPVVQGEVVLAGPLDLVEVVHRALRDDGVVAGGAVQGGTGDTVHLWKTIDIFCDNIC